jgi:hypothetical protein
MAHTLSLGALALIKDDDFQLVTEGEASIEDGMQFVKKTALIMLIDIYNSLGEKRTEEEQKEAKLKLDRLLGSRMSPVNALSGLMEILLKTMNYEKAHISSQSNEEGHELSHLSENDKALIDSFLRKIRRSHFPEEDIN